MKVLNVGAGGRSKSWEPCLPHFEDFKGCEWLTMDIDAAAEPDIVCDILDMEKKMAPDQYDGIWCSHILEHLWSKDIFTALAGMKHVLKPGGKIIILVPDIVFAVIAMLASNKTLTDEYYVAEGLSIQFVDVIYGHHLVTQFNPHYKHHYGFTVLSLQRWMDAAGFEGACVPNPNDQTNVWYRGIKP